jgi:hypothetical protein
MGWAGLGLATHGQQYRSSLALEKRSCRPFFLCPGPGQPRPYLHHRMACSTSAPPGRLTAPPDEPGRRRSAAHPPHLTVKQRGSLFEILEGFTLQLGSPFFMNPIILMGWTIWTARNDLIFKGLQPNFQLSRRTFQKEIALLSLRAKERSADSFESWCQNQF